ncbi:MAG: hypothetical protein N2645_21020 [Clostridia bacterium]|nr:hypothetical protein [Clostridia bacterium]
MNLNDHSSLACAIGFLKDSYEIECIEESRFSYFVFCNEFVVKLRKDVPSVLYELTLEQKKFLTETEFIRGASFEPNIYVRVEPINCSKSANVCNYALVMKKIDRNSRFDNYLREHSINRDITKKLFFKLISIFKTSKIINNRNYSENMNIGNKRLLEYCKEKNSKDFISRWRAMVDETNKLSVLLDLRVDNSFVKELHGDLCFNNIFFDNNNFLFLDPCVASIDMYYIDELYQLADVIVELYRFGYQSEANYLLKLYNSNIIDIQNDLISYYVKRHSLIRATLNFFANDDTFEDYINVWRLF